MTFIKLGLTPSNPRVIVTKIKRLYPLTNMRHNFAKVFLNYGFQQKMIKIFTI